MGKVGVWLIGARGSIAAVTAAGKSAIERGLYPTIGLVTERPEFTSAGLCTLSELVFGGHEVRSGYLPEIASRILNRCGVTFDDDEVTKQLAEFDARIRPGVTRGYQTTPRNGELLKVQLAHTDEEAIMYVRRDLDAFKQKNSLDHLVVVNVASTEPPAVSLPAWSSLETLKKAIHFPEPVLPTSSIYAFGALMGGDAYVNFTPSLGSRTPAHEQLAITNGAVHIGSDGKTGETLIKSVLAEMFVRRNLRILSWFGQNILGNDDGLTLRDPECKESKLMTKGSVLSKILGYTPESIVGIDYVGSLGEVKVAWDHVHFEGFLGGRMTLQFTWSACDSLLAAPLVIDIARLCALAQRRGERGVLTSLAAFFKNPMDTTNQNMISQDEELIKWLRK